MYYFYQTTTKVEKVFNGENEKLNIRREKCKALFGATRKLFLRASENDNREK